MVNLRQLTFHLRHQHHTLKYQLHIQPHDFEICKMEPSENQQRMARGELYYAFTPELTAARARAKHACARYNNAGEVTRRKLTELFREYV
jgi:hypothetical protein